IDVFDAGIISPNSELADEFAVEAGQTEVQTNMGTISEDDIEQHAWYAAAAICSPDQLNEWSCKACKMVAGPDIALSHFGNVTSETRGFVLVSDVGKKIVVSFRGSNGTQNLLTNFKLALEPFSVIPQAGAKVHSGFLTATLSCIEEAYDIVANILNDVARQDYAVYIVGHSMGASMASLGAVWLKEALGLDWDRFRIITYGQLRTGNLQFAKWYDSLPVKVARVVNSNDRVPHLFQDMAILVHHHNEVFLDSSGNLIRCRSDVLEDPDCSNSVPPPLSDRIHLYFRSTVFGVTAC
ncbi:hypothetical protein L0F63_006026, partial [Massospora cicadina]